MNWEVVAYSSATVGIILSLLAIVYYLSTAKNIKKQHARYEQLLADIKVGDEVVFAGGLIGTVQSIDAERVFANIKISGNNTVKATLYSISNIIGK